jgi:predicted RNA-binding Zn-ribbon protein involved in translation (DUF1610 family)
VCPECGVEYRIEDVQETWLRRLYPGLARANIPADPPCVARMRRWGWLAPLGPVLGIVAGSWLNSGTAAVCFLVGGPLSAVAIIAWRSSRVMVIARRAGYQLCLHCGYDMFKSTGAARCPECGESYDPDEARRAWRAWCKER